MNRKSLSSYLVMAVIASGVFWMACAAPVKKTTTTGPTAEELAAARQKAIEDSIRTAQDAARRQAEADAQKAAAAAEAQRRAAEETARRAAAAEEAQRKAVLDAEMQKNSLGTIYFDYDKSNIRDDQKSTAADDAKRLREYKAEDNVLVEGHCDERGTVEYNLALGDRRANSVKAYLTNAGIKKKRISAKSYGKERPAAQGSNEDAWAKNRRAELKRQTPAPAVKK